MLVLLRREVVATGWAGSRARMARWTRSRRRGHMHKAALIGGFMVWRSASVATVPTVAPGWHRPERLPGCRLVPRWSALTGGRPILECAGGGCTAGHTGGPCPLGRPRPFWAAAGPQAVRPRAWRGQQPARPDALLLRRAEPAPHRSQRGRLVAPAPALVDPRRCQGGSAGGGGWRRDLQISVRRRAGAAARVWHAGRPYRPARSTSSSLSSASPDAMRAVR